MVPCGLPVQTRTMALLEADRDAARERARALQRGQQLLQSRVLSLEEKIDSIVANHATELRRVMYEILENHHAGLAAAIRTELRLREMRPEK